LGKLFLLFAAMPIIEIALLLEVGDIIGGWNTVAVVIITAFLGATLVRQQGLQTFMSAQTKMQQGQIPNNEVAEGLLLLVAGVLLVTPGFVTDAIGFLFTLPLTRPIFAKWVTKAVLSKFKVQSNFQFHQQQQGRPFDGSHFDPNAFHQNRSYQHDDGTIEGEYTDKSDIEGQERIQDTSDKKQGPDTHQ